MRRFYALGTLLALAPAAMAQTITGTVIDKDDEPLIGVNVVVVGTQRGAVTDLDGKYTITGLSAGSYNVQFSILGYQSKLFTGIRVTANAPTTLDVTLQEEDLEAAGETVVIGDRPLVDVESGTSTGSMNREQIEAAPVRTVQGVVAQQAGVTADPTGLYIRGGRANETGFIVDGVSAKDPLAGTGFGLDLGSNAFSEVEVTTGGVGADVGDVTSGVVSVRTQEGTDEFHGSFAHKRDNFGLNDDWQSNFNQQLYELSLGGPIIKGKLRFFLSGQAQLEDGFTRFTSNPDSLRSSIVGSAFWTPNAANRWSGLAKVSYDIRPGLKLQASYQRSLGVNQNTRSLQVTGDDAVVAPGFQYAFVRQPDNANTFAHDTNIGYLRLTQVVSPRFLYDLQLSRLFTRLRADANGRPWRPDQITTELDPESLPDYPATIYTGANGQIPNPNALFILPGSGFYNNGGIATRWHDHFAEEWTLKFNGTYYFGTSRNARFDGGFEAKRNDYQWIDVVRPWVGAPIVTATGDTTSSNRLGASSDIWRVQPQRGALFGTGQVRYRGLIANVGLRFEYWAPGKYVDDLVENPNAPILDEVREGYRNSTVELFGLRYKFRLLPKLRVSFPVADNQVLYFNYGQSTRLPHPTFVYTGLDPYYQDRSFFADLGNPNLNPEVDISYELGLKSQITSNDALTVTGFWRDKFDFITIEDVVVRDATGRETVRAFRVNGDFARIRGLELGYQKRIGRWFTGNVSAAFSKATGLSSTANDALAQYLQNGNLDNTVETPLAWDRPLDLKASVTFSRGNQAPLWGIPGLNNYRAYLSTTFRSGQRYTPVEFVGYTANPVTGANDWRPIYRTVQDPEQRYSKVGAPWWWFDLNIQRTFRVFGNQLAATLEITNLFNQDNGVIINPVTGKAYPRVDEANADWVALRGNSNYDVVEGVRDPRFEDPSTTGLPPYNPARYLPQRHVLFGLSYRF
ncbi:MAG: TonB-dependent receptor [Bacteroidetes bacterium]|nr:TonB-dependent receptor [Bacteroidota bacterium]